jgi:predicted enzyme related to lactoylglutathione lyase
MLRDAKNFSSFSVDNIEQAKHFYGEVLELNVETIPEGLTVHLLGNDVFIYPKPNHTPATFTVLNFLIDDIQQTVSSLSAAGVAFEHYDEEYMKTDEQGIAKQGSRSMAWFKDPAGNFLSLIHES